LLLAAILFLVASNAAFAQPRLKVVTNLKFYVEEKLRTHKENLLPVRLSAYIPGIKQELFYATKNNFMHKKLYPDYAEAWLLKQAADSLAMVQKDLAARGYKLKVWDAYRPYRVTKAMWHKIQDERYVANPAKGSGHNKGVTVDITLEEISTGKELNIGTAFDNFSDTASHSFKGLSAEVLQNRLLLRTAMLSHGFAAYEKEWWHYTLRNTKDFPVLDFSFRELKKFAQSK
jgi:zinc D-Ala-D-Ala dipeptidase